MSKPAYKEKGKKRSHDWRPFVRVVGEQVGPFSSGVYCLAAILKNDFQAMKGPPGAIVYGEAEKDLRIGFLKSEFETLEAELRACADA